MRTKSEAIKCSMFLDRPYLFAQSKNACCQPVSANEQLIIKGTYTAFIPQQWALLCKMILRLSEHLSEIISGFPCLNGPLLRILGLPLHQGLFLDTMEPWHVTVVRERHMTYNRFLQISRDEIAIISVLKSGSCACE